MIDFTLEFDGVNVQEDLLGNNSRASLRYIARCSAAETEQEVREALKAIAPQSYQSLVLTGVGVLNMVADNPGDRIYNAEASYSQPQGKEPPKPKDETTVVLEIRSGGGTTLQRTFSEGLVEEVFNNPAFQLAGTAAEKILGLKAADPDDGNTLNAQGIPFKASGTQLIVHAWKPFSAIAGGYLQTVADAAARQVCNAGLYKGFEGGSLQFIDWTATANVGTNGGWDFAFTFDYARGSIPSVPGLPDFTTKRLGHEYLDVLFMPQLVPVKNIVLPVPVRAAIHKIYDLENFADYFGI